jgi:hypothetical protein
LMGYNHGQWVQPTHDQGIVMVIYHGIYNQPTMRIAFSCVYIYIYSGCLDWCFFFNGCLDWLGWCNSRLKGKKQQTWYSHEGIKPSTMASDSHFEFIGMM